MKPIQPRCRANYPQYVSAEGQWFPCCFASQRHRDWKSDWFYVNREKFDLKKRSLEEIYSGEELRALEQLWFEDQGHKAPYWCQVMCRSKDGRPVQVFSGAEKS